MTNSKETKIVKDPSGKKLIITRNFDASPEKVWQAWTEKNLLEQWWAPKPWKAKTQNFDFKAGGEWLYIMAGPQGEEHWCRVSYKTIDPLKGFTAVDAFCDENGNTKTDMPSMNWDTRFSAGGTGTLVTVTVSFDDEASLEKIMEMGFKEGFTMALDNLDELLAG